MRIALTGVCALLLLIPFTISAETAEELQAKINTLLQQIKALQDQLVAQNTPAPAASAATCPVLTRLLTVGSRGADVTALQEFLRAKGYMADAATGYFGSLTEAAVKKMQAANNVVSSGNPATTGYGAVGPKTRAMIATLCSAATPNTVSAETTQCAEATSPTPPTISCGGKWEKLQNLGCHIGWRCILPSGANKAPVISAIDGPTSLETDTFGSWQIRALDPEGGALSYNVTWGDEGIEDILKAIAGLSGTFTSASQVTHSYQKAGNYTMQVTVKDTSGATAIGALAIKVGASGTTTPVTTPFSPYASSTPTEASCITPWGNQVVTSKGSVYWQPFFTEGAYYSSTSPIVKCDNGGWLKCDTAGNNCQAYTHATSTPSTAALPSFTTSIGQSCSPEGSTRQVQVPPGTQLCQWLSCRITTQVETLTLKCTHSGWTDYAKY